MSRITKYIICGFLFLGMVSCTNSSSNHGSNEVTVKKERKYPQLFEVMPESHTHFNFTNEVKEDLRYNFLNFYYIYNGGGVGVGDINNDGLQDIYMVTITGANKLFLNKGNLQFEDITAKAGVAAADGVKTGVVLVDINADGYLDIYLCKSGNEPATRSNLLFINNKDLTFSEKAKEYGLDDQCPTTTANFFDYDLDGDLDLYLLNHPIAFETASQVNVIPDAATGRLQRICKPINPYESDRLYRNNGNNTFSDVSKQAGIENRAFGLSVTVNDFNFDGYPDILVGNDFVEPDILYINNRNGTFTDKKDDYFRHTSMHTMGVDIADINNDGYNDVFALDMNAEFRPRQRRLMTTMEIEKQNTLQQYGYGRQFMRNTLQVNPGVPGKSFSEIGCFSKISNTDWSWCCFIQDFDNDGLNDVFINNGYLREVNDLDYIHFTLDSIIKTNNGKINLTPQALGDYLKKIKTTKVPDYCFKNLGNFNFDDVSEDWGFGMPNLSNGAAYADLDNDGDLDLVVNNQLDPAMIFKNKGRELYPNNNYLQLKFQGSSKNPIGVGVAARFVLGDQVHYKEMTPTRGFVSSVEPILHFGLGTTSSIPKLEIKWPDGKIQTIENVKSNQTLTIKYTDAKPGKWSNDAIPQGNPFFTEISGTEGLRFVHQELPYNDFDREFLIPHKLSGLGPCIAVADVNGDKLDDYFIGGSFTATGGIYVQTPAGGFKNQPQYGFIQDTIFEDVSALFFDADNDSDKDLLVVSGGNQFNKGDANYYSRVYFNDGKGNFAFTNNSILKVKDNGGAATVADIDSDGDLDIFIGCRSVTGKYPSIPQSYIFKNDRGVFTDVTDQVSPDFKTCGMISGLQSADIDKDGKTEIIAVGEWMPISVFKLVNGKYVNSTSNFGLSEFSGWWNCVSLEDLDGDGDLDILAGNEGLNTRFQVSEKEPLEVFAKDFDNNGAIDPILTFVEQGKRYPIQTRDLLVKQMPSLKKKYLYYRDYAEASIDDMFSKKDLDAAQHLTARTYHTSWFENNGGKFIEHKLPQEAQYSPVYGIVCFDVNKDGKNDIILVGNKWGSEVLTGQEDAGNGLLLLNKDGKNFTSVPMRKSGISAGFDAKALAVLKAKNQNLLLVGNNNNVMQVFAQK